MKSDSEPVLLTVKACQRRAVPMESTRAWIIDMLLNDVFSRHLHEELPTADRRAVSIR
ncbi:hypothetical protein BRPE64_ECDS03220 (plasmid) [Caballeronia insecticola]|uniref:Uncharacterized protein n=1 Tax=Caballeronia insecticola TaxID=758793 RepID=A0A060PRE6_9BURK|nr:hypothetical protein BRPE64_ECDS03220 [Caballeronia insecticola]